MKKTISILSIIAIVLATIALLTGIISLTVFWKSSCQLYAAGNASVIAAGPIFPLNGMTYIVGGLLVAILLSIFTKTSKSIVFEIIAIAVLAAVIPILMGLLYTFQSLMMSQMGSTALLALTVSTTSFSTANSIMGIAETLCLVVCGMSIAQKVHAKETVQ